MFYSIIVDSTGNPIGSHAYVETPKSLPANEVACTSAQASNPHAWKLVKGTLVEQLSFYQQDQISKLSTSCQAAIEAGFTSSALGTSNTYGCKATDQMNINLAAVGGGGIWCADSTGAWSFVNHSATQAQQVQKDMIAHIQAERTHYATQVTAVNNATAVTTIQSIVW